MASDRIEFKISGVPQLIERMRLLPSKLQNRGLKKAVRAGAEKIAEYARREAQRIDDPSTPEAIPVNIAAQYASRSSRSLESVIYRVGVLGGAKQGGGGGPGGDTWYWRLVEFGTSKTRARPFMRPAMRQSAEYAAEEVATVLEQELDRVVKEL